MLLATVFDRFVEDSPLTVMARALLEQALQPGPIDEMFERTATARYTDKLLFSTVVDLMGLVVCGFYKRAPSTASRPCGASRRRLCRARPWRCSTRSGAWSATPSPVRTVTLGDAPCSGP